jgi:hypothetical protein
MTKLSEVLGKPYKINLQSYMIRASWKMKFNLSGCTQKRDYRINYGNTIAELKTPGSQS